MPLINEQGIDDSTKKKGEMNLRSNTKVVKPSFVKMSTVLLRFLETLIKLNPLSYNTKHGYQYFNNNILSQGREDSNL